MKSDESQLAELDAFIRAHGQWLRKHGVSIDADPVTLTAVCMMPDVDLSGANASSSPLTEAVLKSLQRLAALRSIILGPAHGSRRYEAALASAEGDHKAYLISHRASIEAAHDDTALQALRPQMREAKTRLKTLRNGLAVYQQAQVEKHQKFSPSFRDQVHPIERYVADVEQLTAQIVSLESSIGEFENAVGSVARSLGAAVGLSAPDVWGTTIGDLKADIQGAGASGADIMSLFPSGSEFESQRDVNRKQIQRAKKKRE